MAWYWVDLAILGIIALSVLTGLIRGFLKELIAICIWILAIWVAWHYSGSLDPWLKKYLQDQTARTVTAFVLLLVATLIAGAIVNGLINFIVKRSGLSGTDRLLGMGFGFIRGVFIVSLIMAVIKMTALPVGEYEKQSKLYASFDPIVNWMTGLLPGVIHRAKSMDPASLVDFQSDIKSN